jgi:hypothetical protein
MNIVQSGPFDSQKHGLSGVWFNVLLQHNTLKVLPTGPVTNKKPYAVLIAEDGKREVGGRVVVGFSWSLTASNEPQVTVQLQGGGSLSLDARVCVLYKV